MPPMPWRLAPDCTNGPGSVLGAERSIPCQLGVRDDFLNWLIRSA